MVSPRCGLSPRSCQVATSSPRHGCGREGTSLHLSVLESPHCPCLAHMLIPNPNQQPSLWHGTLQSPQNQSSCVHHLWLGQGGQYGWPPLQNNLAWKSVPWGRDAGRRSPHAHPTPYSEGQALTLTRWTRPSRIGLRFPPASALNLPCSPRPVEFPEPAVFPLTTRVHSHPDTLYTLA